MGIDYCQWEVRRVWMCGKDPVTGKNFHYPQVWIQHPSAFLAARVAIDICLIAIMSDDY